MYGALFSPAHNENLLNQNNSDSHNDQICNCTRVECPLPNANPPNNCRQKDTVYEGGIRGAGFLLSPLLNKSGYEHNGLMHIVDWVPTLLDIAGGSNCVR